MKLIIKSFLISISFILLLTMTVSAYDNDFVHQMITGNALNKSIFFLQILNKFGYKDIFDSINKKEIYKWYNVGAKLEDETVCRSKFHFHDPDPDKSWDEAGLNNISVDTLCTDYRHKSSLVWAQDGDNDWSWQKAKQFYFEALTSSNAAEREKNLADTFRSLGQIMHLIADSSVPAHTRNDIHVFPYTVPYIGITLGSPTFESWAKKQYQNLPYEVLNIPHSVFQNAAADTIAPAPISALWDQNIYDMTNPSITVDAVTGLAEYSNANFFSKDTILSDYPYPAWSSVVETTEEIDGKERIYIKKIEDGDTVEHLAAARWFYKYLPSQLKRTGLKLDEQVFADYAAKLIPRAVGYSTALLDYFFRGTLDITTPDSTVYSIIDGSQTPYIYDYTDESDVIQQIPQQQFTHIKAKIMNTTPGEDIEDGMLQAVARYKMRKDYEADLSTDPPSGDARENDFFYSVSNALVLTQDDINAINSTEYQEFTFDFTGDPIPAGVTDLYLHIIFKGTLGSENDTAIAIGTKDIMEPTHHVFWNLTDMFSLEGHLYTSPYIKEKPSLAHKVDYDRDNVFNEIQIGEPYIDPVLNILTVSYMSSPDPQDPVNSLAAVTLPPGRYIRLLTLLDKETDNRLRLTWSDGIYPDAYHDFAFSGTVNQDEIDQDGNTFFMFTTPDMFREIHQHFSQGVLNCEPPAGAHECAYSEDEAIAPPDLMPYPLDNIFFP